MLLQRQRAGLVRPPADQPCPWGLVGRVRITGLAEHPVTSGSDSRSAPVGGRSRKTTSFGYSSGSKINSFTARWGSALRRQTREGRANGTPVIGMDAYFCLKCSRQLPFETIISQTRILMNRHDYTSVYGNTPLERIRLDIRHLEVQTSRLCAYFFFLIDGDMLRGRSGVLALIRRWIFSRLFLWGVLDRGSRVRSRPGSRFGIWRRIEGWHWRGWRTVLRQGFEDGHVTGVDWGEDQQSDGCTRRDLTAETQHGVL